MDNEDIPEELLRRGMELSANGMQNFFVYFFINHAKQLASKKSTHDTLAHGFL